MNSGSYELQKVEVEPKSVEIINSLLKDLKGLKHRQRKIPSVSQAYEMWEGKDKEILVLCKNKLINLTSQIEYDLNQKQLGLLIGSTPVLGG